MLLIVTILMKEHRQKGIPITIAVLILMVHMITAVVILAVPSHEQMETGR